ncbi:MAG: HIT family protein [Nanoarchaeota archaeon]
MSDTLISKAYSEGKLSLIYEDEDLLVFLDPAPVVPGHMVVAPKNPYTILEEVPDWLVGKLGEVANKASTAAFEVFGAKGTNIIMHNGTVAGQEHPHVCINVIPRFDNDGLNFLWKPKQLTEEEMSTVELTLKQGTETVGSFEKKKPAKKIVEPPKEPEAMLPEEDNLMLRQLDRVP